MSKINESKTRSLTLEIDNPEIRKTLKLWQSDVKAHSTETIIHEEEWLGEKLKVKYYHPSHGEVALDVYYAGKTKIQVRTRVSHLHGMYFSCDLPEEEYLTIRIG